MNICFIGIKTPWANTPLELGWENYFKVFNLFNTVMKPFPMLRYRIMDTLIPIMIKHRKKLVKEIVMNEKY